MPEFHSIHIGPHNLKRLVPDRIVTPVSIENEAGDKLPLPGGVTEMLVCLNENVEMKYEHWLDIPLNMWISDAELDYIYKEWIP